MALVVMVLVGLLACAGAAMADGTTNSGDNLRTGWYPNAAISPEVVSGGTFGQLWSAAVNGEVYAQPLVDESTDSVIVATEDNDIYALKGSNGGQQWETSLGNPWNPADLSCGDITPYRGLTATPVIDPSTDTVYLTHKTYVSGTSGPAEWYMDALSVATGQERPHFPVLITTPDGADNDPSVSFDAQTEDQRPGLLLMNGVVYAAFGGICDSTPWTGWIFGVSASSGAITARWEDNATQDGAGIWQSGVGLMSDGSNSLFFITGNGGSPTVAAPGSSPPQSFGETVARLDVQPDGSLEPVDFFTPFDAQQLDSWDGDFGSGGLVGLPSQYFGTPSTPDLAVVVGKEGYVYLLNRNDLGGYEQGSGGGDDVVQRLGPFGGVWGRAGVWPGDGGYVYVPTSSGESSGGLFDAYKYGVTGTGAPALASAGAAADVFGWGSGSPVITSDQTASGSALVWIIWSPNRGGAGAQLRAYDPVPVNGTLQEVYQASIGTSTNYSMPGVGDDGRLYVGTRNGEVLAYGSPVTQPVSGSALSFSATTIGSSSAPQTMTLTANEPVTISSLASTSSQFTLGEPSLPLPATLKTGETISVPVSFSPTDTGPVGGDLTVTTDSGSVSIPLSGTGQAAEPDLQGSGLLISLGGTAIGDTLSGTVTFSNVGAAPLTVSSEHLPAAPFSAVGTPTVGSTIAAGHSVTIEIDFAPTQVGQYSDYIELDGDGQEVQIGLSASAGTPGVLQISNENVDFGSVTVGTTESESFTLTNSGGTDVTIYKSKPPFGGEFTASTALPEGTTLIPGQTVTETVAFAPTVDGPVTGTWAITGDDGSGPQLVEFTGSGSVTPRPSPVSQTPPASTVPVIYAIRPALPTAPKVVPSVMIVTKIAGTWVTYTAQVAASSQFTLERKETGRTSFHGCVPITAGDRDRPRCSHFVTILKFTHFDQLGLNRVRLDKLVPARRLIAGTYRLRSVLYDSTLAPRVFLTALRIDPAPARRRLVH